MIAPARAYAPPAVLIVGLTAALALRLALAGDEGAASIRAGVVFGLALFALGLAAGRFRLRVGLTELLWGIGGAAVLVAGPLVLRLNSGVGVSAPLLTAYPMWPAAVTFVAVAEELFFRGVLYGAIERVGGPLPAVALTALAFGLLHVPLYGWHALPLDLAVGIWFGALRMITRSVEAPALAHILADLAGWWFL